MHTTLLLEDDRGRTHCANLAPLVVAQSRLPPHELTQCTASHARHSCTPSAQAHVLLARSAVEAEIERRTGVPKHEQRLVLNGRPMPEMLKITVSDEANKCGDDGANSKQDTPLGTLNGKCIGKLNMLQGIIRDTQCTGNGEPSIAQAHYVVDDAEKGFDATTMPTQCTCIAASPHCLHSCDYEALPTMTLPLPPIRMLLRLNGGKGGFGSTLRALGAKFSQVKTTNFDACRDLSGRRVRHINTEKQYVFFSCVLDLYYFLDFFCRLYLIFAFFHL